MDRPLTIAILALGGQGGGVLTRWLVELARAGGYRVQSTYVAGVAQRTGATVYCVEMFPKADDRRPIFTPYPVPGDVDLVVAGELAEVGRALQKGFVTSNCTTLIASSHRIYSIHEKSALGDGILDQTRVVDLARSNAREFVSFDMAQAADSTGSVISAVLFGAIASTDALPFDKHQYEQVIEQDGRSVKSNLAGFEAGYARTTTKMDQSGDRVPLLAEPQGEAGRQLIDKVREQLPEQVQINASHGALRTLEYQDRCYADLYLQRLGEVVALDRENGGANHGFALSVEVARHLALQMCYEDTIRVAEIKTSKARHAKVRQHLGVSVDQPAHVIEYFHPRIEEFCDTLPRGLGERIVASERARRLLSPFFSKGRNLATNHIFTHLLLSAVAGLRRWRRGTLRYSHQNTLIEEWLQTVREASTDYPLAVALASSIGVIKGYGETYERGLSRFREILRVSGALDTNDKANTVIRLVEAAEADEDGTHFTAAMAELSMESRP